MGWMGCSSSRSSTLEPWAQKSQLRGVDFNKECTWRQKSKIIQKQDQELVVQGLPTFRNDKKLESNLTMLTLLKYSAIRFCFPRWLVGVLINQKSKGETGIPKNNQKPASNQVQPLWPQVLYPLHENKNHTCTWLLNQTWSTPTCLLKEMKLNQK